MNNDLHGITLAYDDEGSGLPLVLLHAFPLNRSMWQPTVAALKDTYRLIVPDLRGLGASPIAATATPRAMADDVIALLDQLGLQKVVVAGVSMGGYVALDLMRRFPQRVQVLILADTRARADDVETQENRQALAEKVQQEGSAAVADQLLPNLLGSTTHQQRPELVAQVRAMIEANAPEGIAAASLGMAERTDSRPFVPMFNVPTLVLVGDEDELTPYSDAQAIAVALDSAELVTIPQAGHLSNLENPHAFNQAVRSFLEQHPG